MDIKQFNLFQETVQYAIDEEKHAAETGLKSHFNMSSWLAFGYRPQERGITFKPIVDVPGLEGYSRIENLSMGTCGTAACLAGTAVMLHGDTPVLETSEIGHGDGAAYVVTDEGKLKSMHERGQEVLGLTAGQAARLFMMTGETLDQIVDTCERIAESHGYKLEVVR